MSCYFRHLKTVFDVAGVEATPANKKKIDMAVHELVGVDYKDCPQTWRRVKALLTDDREHSLFVARLKEITR